MNPNHVVYVMMSVLVIISVYLPVKHAKVSFVGIRKNRPFSNPVQFDVKSIEIIEITARHVDLTNVKMLVRTSVHPQSSSLAFSGMALDKIRFGKPPKIFRSSSSTNSSVKLEPNNDDFQLMLKLLECYQSFEESDHQTTTNNHASIIFQFCHRLADIVMAENERIPETFFARLKRHESAIKFLITGENEENSLSWSKEPQAWLFAHNERWRLIMILLILAFDDEQIGALEINDHLPHSNDDIILERILRLFELECDQERETRLLTEGTNLNEKNLKYMKAQFILRFVDMMTNDMISNRIHSSNEIIFPSYLLSDEHHQTNEMIYLSCEDEIPSQTTDEHY